MMARRGIVGDVAHFFLHSSPLGMNDVRRIAFDDNTRPQFPPYLPSFFEDFGLAVPGLRELVAVVPTIEMTTDADAPNDWCIHGQSQADKWTAGNVSYDNKFALFQESEAVSFHLRVSFQVPQDFETLSPSSGFAYFIGFNFNPVGKIPTVSFCGSSTGNNRGPHDFTSMGTANGISFDETSRDTYFRLLPDDCDTNGECRLLVAFEPENANFHAWLSLFKMKKDWIKEVVDYNTGNEGDYEDSVSLQLPAASIGNCFSSTTTTTKTNLVVPTQTTTPMESRQTSSTTSFTLSGSIRGEQSSSVASTSSTSASTSSNEPDSLAEESISPDSSDFFNEIISNNSPVTNSETDGLSVGALVGVVILGVVALIFFAFVAVLVLKKKKNQANSSGGKSMESDVDNNYGNLSSFSNLD